MSKIAIFTDLHIGVHQNAENWYSVGIRAIKWMKKICLENKVSHIIFCGDFYDTRHELNNKTLNVGKGIIDYLRSDFNLHFIVGNHDCYLKEDTTINSLNNYRGLPNVFVYDKLNTINIDNLNITLVPWLQEKNEIPESDIICGHFEINDFKMVGSKLCEGKIDAKQLLSKAPLIISGHFHNQQVKEYKKYNSKIVYIGSLFQLNFGEKDYDKGFILLDAETKDYEFILNDISPKHYIFKSDELLKDVDKFKKYVKNNIIKIIFDNSVSNEERDKVYSIFQTLEPFDMITEFENTDMKINNSIEAVDDMKIEDVFISYIDSLDFDNKDALKEYVLHKYDIYR